MKEIDQTRPKHHMTVTLLATKQKMGSQKNSGIVGVIAVLFPNCAPASHAIAFLNA